jgi:DNA-binding CsgD family transcriptional regulator
MSGEVPIPLSIAIRLSNADLAERAALLLGDVPGIRLVREGEPANVELSEAPALAAGPALTPRELEVLSLLAEGASNKAIARRLNISVHTAKFHVGQVLDKLDANGRTDAVTLAARQGVIHL